MTFLKYPCAVLIYGLATIAPALAQSTINPALPAAGLPYSSSVIRGQFDSAYSDINALFAATGGAFPSTNTLATLQAITSPPSAQCVQRLGFAAIGDGGNALYCWNAASTATNDGGYAVLPTGHVGPGRWLAQGPVYSLLIWGADNADTADSGPQWQLAYNAMSPLGICVFVPAGTYKISTQVAMASTSPCFHGAGYNEAPNNGTKHGTWVHVTSTGVQPFLISTSQSVSGQGSGFSNMAFFNDQPTPTAGWAPSAYQYIFQVDGGGIGLTFDHLYFYNTTHCLTSTTSGRLHLTNWAGQPLGTCVYIDNAQDVMFLTGPFDFWPNWTNGSGGGTIDPDRDVIKYTQTNIDPIVLKRADSPSIGDVFALGYHSAISFQTSGFGSNVTGAQIENIQGDAVKFGVWISASNVTAQIGNVRTAAGNWSGSGVIPSSEGYRDEGSGSVVAIGNFQNFSSGGNAVHLTGASNLSIGTPILWGFNADDTNSVGLNVAAGSLLSVGTCPQVANLSHAAATFGGVGLFSSACFRQSWTPSLVGSSTSGSPTYTTRIGDYWFDGSKVTANFNVTYSGVLSGFAGTMSLSGLPLTSVTTAGHTGSCVMSDFNGITLDASFNAMQGIVPVNGTLMQFIEINSGQTSTLVPTGAFGSGATVAGTCTYAAF